MASDARIFRIVCECCGAKIEVDSQTRTIFSTEKEGMKKKTFEEVMKKVTSVGDRAQEKFEQGMKREQNREEHLDRLFKEAKAKADADPNKRPPNIFDYD